jgi:hypothetical protein
MENEADFALGLPEIWEGILSVDLIFTNQLFDHYISQFLCHYKINSSHVDFS